MNLYDEIYISGSFALSIFTLEKKYIFTSNDIDFYIKIKDIKEINKIINIFSYFNEKYDYPFLKYINKTKETPNNYDFTTNKMFVYNILFNSKNNIDIIFILEPIEEVLQYVDFQMLRNYISVDKTQINKFIYKSLYFEDIANKILRFNPLYVKHMDLTINEKNHYNYNYKLIYNRILKYTKRKYTVLYSNYLLPFYNINSLILHKSELNCCICLENKPNIINQFTCNDKHHICHDCFKLLNKKKCPLCRENYNIFELNYYKKIIIEFINNKNLINLYKVNIMYDSELTYENSILN
jgi:hypothetical protein